MPSDECPFCGEDVYLGSTDELFDYVDHLEEHAEDYENNPICERLGHDWQSGQMYSDGWTDTCQRCDETREVDR